MLFAGVMLTNLALDLVALLRSARGRDAALMDVTLTADDGRAEPALVSRRAKWLAVYPCCIGVSPFVLWRRTPATCA